MAGVLLGHGESAGLVSGSPGFPWWRVVRLA